MDTDTIVPLSKIKPRLRCPKCASASITRSSSIARGLVSLDSGALFSVTERCIMCGWVRTIENVRMGA